MKKQDILDILAQEFFDNLKRKKDNYERCGIKDFEAFKNKYIASFLSDNQETYGFIFDLNSNDKEIATKSKIMLDNMAFEFKEGLREFPEYFLEDVNNIGVELACYNLCFQMFLFNDIKELMKERKNIDYVELIEEKNKSIDNK